MRKEKKIMVTVAVVTVLVLIVAGIVIAANHKSPTRDKQSAKPSSTEIVGKNDTDEEDANQGNETREPEPTQGEILKEEPQQEELDESQAVTMKTTTNVNFRKEPNTNCEIIRVIPRGTELQKYAEENGWAKVKCGEEIGYVSAEYLVDPSVELSQPPSTSAKVEAIPGQHRDANSAVVVIDPGHQRQGDSTKEPNGPGSSTMKARVSGGTTGVATGVPEYVLNLDISLKLKTELENRGYTVYLTRTSHDVDISNMKRAQYATSVGADIAVRIHANGASGSSVNGAETLAPSANNPYVSHLAAASQSLGRCILDAYCTATGFQKRGVITSDTMTGINWSEVPVTIIELGFMSNAAEDRAMQDVAMQNNMVQGIANGIDVYFGF